ncbi:DUF4238 domain-containing protein [Pseudomonas sp. AIG]
MKGNFTKNNHYVPQWLQKRFINYPQNTKLHYLDLNPGFNTQKDGRKTPKRELEHFGTKKAFKKEHLYTLYFGENSTDIVEKKFFGDVDRKGEQTISSISHPESLENTTESFLDFVKFMCAQLFRTPKMLEIFDNKKAMNHQFKIGAMGVSYELFLNSWTEGIWEIVSCTQSQTKFIISDAPITTYNRKIFPKSNECTIAGQAIIERVGTQTIFPLCIDRCLIITRPELVKNPGMNPLKIRSSPKYYENSVFDTSTIQFGREVSEEEVIAINFILKTNSKKYIGALDKNWLFPEANIKTTFWPSIGDSFFLQPDPRLISLKKLNAMIDAKQPQKSQQKENEIFFKSRSRWDERDIREGRTPKTHVNLNTGNISTLVPVMHDTNLYHFLRTLSAR